MLALVLILSDFFFFFFFFCCLRVDFLLLSGCLKFSFSFRGDLKTTFLGLVTLLPARAPPCL